MTKKKVTADLKIQTNHIKLQCGTDVKVGMKVYERNIKQSDYNGKQTPGDPDNYYVKMHGKTRVSYITHKVISVNESLGSRSFVIRSKKGCEQSYSVKDTCVSNLFGSLKAVEKDHKYYRDSDIKNIQKKITEAHNAFAKDKKHYKDSLEKISKAISNLQKVKVEFCDC